MVDRIIFMQWIKDGNQEEYVEAHKNIWQEVIEDHKAAGIRNYTGYIGGPDDRLVVGYFETDDFEETTAFLAQSDANTRWAEMITPLMETGGDMSDGSMEFMKPLWRID